jgi:hypothetical protein
MRKRWLVSVSLPIEAEDEAAAAAEFWRYVRELGARDLPVFVAPQDDELAMRTYVHGEFAEQDPEDAEG